MVEALSREASAARAQTAPLGQLPALTSLRFFAALHVVFYHYLTPLVSGSSFLARIASHGYLSVSFFYVLSGFVLAHAYGEERSFGPDARRRFWQKRFARIYPIYLFAFLAYAPFIVRHRLDEGGVLAALKLAVSAGVNLAGLQAWLPPLSSSWNAPSWSISVEAFFYLLFPWLLMRLQRTRRLLVSMLAMWLLALLVPVLATTLQLAPASASPAAAALGPFLRYCPLLHLPAFAFGILLRRLRARQEVSAVWVPVCVLALAGILAVAPPAVRLVLHNGGLLPILGLLVLAASTPQRLLGGPLHHRALVFLGESSYALYILQVPVWLWLVRLGWPLSSNVHLLGYLSALVAVSGIAHVLLERPAQRHITSFFLRQARAT